MTKSPLVIIPCGREKCGGPAAAGEMYVGLYFRACLKTALALTGRENIRILSGKHGLLKLDKLIEPYDQRIDKPGAITAEEVRKQAEKQGLAGAKNVIVLAGQTYSDVVLKIWPKAAAPLYRLAGIGRHLKRLKQFRAKK